MSSTAEPGGGGLETSAAHRYFQAIETTFIALRGAPLLLSPSDYQLTKRWYEAGVPLRLVERKLVEIFERRRKKEGEDGKRKLITLRYCRRVIERAWKLQRELLAAGQADEAEAMDVGARLARLAAALPPEVPEREVVAERIRGLEGDAEKVEESLMELDQEILQDVRAGLEPAPAAEIRERLSAALAPLAARLPKADLERAEGRLRDQILRETLALPVLSLFAPEAEAA